VHELRHVYQRHAAIHDVKNWVVPQVGPAWFLEGDASEIQLHYKFGRDRDFLNWKIEQSSKSNEKLSSFSTYNNPKFSPDGYYLGQLAAWMLKERYGQNAIDLYWLSLKHETSFDAAFYRAFKIRMSDFILQFDDVRKNRSAILRWIRK